MSSKLINYFLVFYFIFFNSNAYAYLDPGTGSLILSAVIAFLATLSTKISYVWSRLKKILKKKNNKKKK
jgi:hypothetical protein